MSDNEQSLKEEVERLTRIVNNLALLLVVKGNARPTKETRDAAEIGKKEYDEYSRRIGLL